MLKIALKMMQGLEIRINRNILILNIQKGHNYSFSNIYRSI